MGSLKIGDWAYLVDKSFVRKSEAGSRILSVTNPGKKLPGKVSLNSGMTTFLLPRVHGCIKVVCIMGHVPATSAEQAFTEMTGRVLFI
jgi:hypothetical protein